MRTPPAWLPVAAGGACGAVLRHLVGLALPDEPLSWTVVLVNLVGAFALGLVSARPQGVGGVLFWRTGVLGAFTTFSAMTVETVELGVVAGAVYVLALTAGGVGAALLGLRWGARHRRSP